MWALTTLLAAKAMSSQASLQPDQTRADWRGPITGAGGGFFEIGN